MSQQQTDLGTPASLPSLPQDQTASSGLSPTLATAILPSGAGEKRQFLSDQSDAISDDKLAFAVRAVMGTKPAHFLQGASLDQTKDCRLVEDDASDEMLLKGVARGDKAAMHILFARHRIGVFRFIQRMVRDRVIADDIVSQVFLDVWRSANRFDIERASLHGYFR